jgi:hypothetical protein
VFFSSDDYDSFLEPNNKRNEEKKKRKGRKFLVAVYVYSDYCDTFTVPMIFLDICVRA